MPEHGAAPGDPSLGEETAEAFTPVAENIISAVQAVLSARRRNWQPMWRSAVLLTGGGRLLQGMDTPAGRPDRMETHLAEDPIRAVALGLEQTPAAPGQTAGRGPEPGTPAAADGVRPSMEPSLWKQSLHPLHFHQKKKPGKFPGFLALSRQLVQSHSSGNNSSRMCRAFFPPFSKPPRQDLQ